MVGVEINLPEVNVPPGTLQFVQRILGPFAEAGDFLSDRIKYYRWKSSLKVLDEAQKIARERGINPKEIPLKVFVPLLEKASLEDEDSPLISRWASLLAESAQNPGAAQAIYVDILSRLSGQDVIALEKIVSEKIVQEIVRDPHDITLDSRITIALAVHQDAFYNFVRDEVEGCCRGRTKEEYRDDLQDFLWSLITNEMGRVVEVVTAAFRPFEKDNIYRFNIEFAAPSVIDVLFSCGLLSRRQFSFQISAGEVFVTLLAPTPLGVKFVAACRGDTLTGKKD